MPLDIDFEGKIWHFFHSTALFLFTKCNNFLLSRIYTCPEICPIDFVQLKKDNYVRPKLKFPAKIVMAFFSNISHQMMI